MSNLSVGIANKGDKNKAKFKTVDINNVYKGTAVAPSRSSGVRTQHGLQSLGKVASARRMPPPVHLPSLRSETGGTDLNVNLVPTGGSGWGSKEEEKLAKSSAGVGSALVAPRGVAQKGGDAPSSAVSQPLKSSVAAGAELNNVGTSGATAAAIIGGAAGGASSVRGSSSEGGQLWSTLTSGIKPAVGGRLQNCKAAQFQDEFPELAAGLAAEEASQLSKKEKEKEKEKQEVQYGPGPSLRPQNVASWRGGGGRSMPNQLAMDEADEDEEKVSSSAPPAASTRRRSASSDEDEPAKPASTLSYYTAPPSSVYPSGDIANMTRMMRPGMVIPPPGAAPGMVYGPPMMPPFMFRGRPGFPPQRAVYPPNFMPSGHFYPDPRFRGMMPHLMHRPMMAFDRRTDNSAGRTEGYVERSAIITDQTLREFDSRLETADGGWAGAAPDVDYNTRLVFSDEEELPTSGEKLKSDKTEMQQKSGDRWDSRDNHGFGRDRDSDRSSRNASYRDRDRQNKSSQDGTQNQSHSGYSNRGEMENYRDMDHDHSDHYLRHERTHDRGTAKTMPLHNMNTNRDIDDQDAVRDSYSQKSSDTTSRGTDKAPGSRNAERHTSKENDAVDKDGNGDRKKSSSSDSTAGGMMTKLTSFNRKLKPSEDVRECASDSANTAQSVLAVPAEIPDRRPLPWSNKYTPPHMLSGAGGKSLPHSATTTSQASNKEQQIERRGGGGESKVGSSQYNSSSTHSGANGWRQFAADNNDRRNFDRELSRSQPRRGDLNDRYTTGSTTLNDVDQRQTVDRTHHGERHGSTEDDNHSRSRNDNQPLVRTGAEQVVTTIASSDPFEEKLRCCDEDTAVKSFNYDDKERQEGGQSKQVSGAGRNRDIQISQQETTRDNRESQGSGGRKQEDKTRDDLEVTEESHRSLSSEDYNDAPDRHQHRRQDGRHHKYPPPMPLSRTNQNVNKSSHYTPLKRTHSNTAAAPNLSNSSNQESSKLQSFSEDMPHGSSDVSNQEFDDIDGSCWISNDVTLVSNSDATRITNPSWSDVVDEDDLEKERTAAAISREEEARKHTAEQRQSADNKENTRRGGESHNVKKLSREGGFERDVDEKPPVKRPRDEPARRGGARDNYYRRDQEVGNNDKADHHLGGDRGKSQRSSGGQVDSRGSGRGASSETSGQTSGASKRHGGPGIVSKPAQLGGMREASSRENLHGGGYKNMNRADQKRGSNVVRLSKPVHSETEDVNAKASLTRRENMASGSAASGVSAERNTNAWKKPSLMPAAVSGPREDQVIKRRQEQQPNVWYNKTATISSELTGDNGTGTVQQMQGNMQQQDRPHTTTSRAACEAINDKQRLDYSEVSDSLQLTENWQHLQSEVSSNELVEPVENVWQRRAAENNAKPNQLTTSSKHHTDQRFRDSKHNNSDSSAAKDDGVGEFSSTPAPPHQLVVSDVRLMKETDLERVQCQTEQRRRRRGNSSEYIQARRNECDSRGISRTEGGRGSDHMRRNQNEDQSSQKLTPSVAHNNVWTNELIVQTEATQDSKAECRQQPASDVLGKEEQKPDNQTRHHGEGSREEGRQDFSHRRGGHRRRGAQSRPIVDKVHTDDISESSNSRPTHIRPLLEGLDGGRYVKPPRRDGFGRVNRDSARYRRDSVVYRTDRHSGVQQDSRQRQMRLDNRQPGGDSSIAHENNRHDDRDQSGNSSIIRTRHSDFVDVDASGEGRRVDGRRRQSHRRRNADFDPIISTRGSGMSRLHGPAGDRGEIETVHGGNADVSHRSPRNRGTSRSGTDLERVFRSKSDNSQSGANADQNSDLGAEEWETASESSDVLSAVHKSGRTGYLGTDINFTSATDDNICYTDTSDGRHGHKLFSNGSGGNGPRHGGGDRYKRRSNDGESQALETGDRMMLRGGNQTGGGSSKGWSVRRDGNRSARRRRTHTGESVGGDGLKVVEQRMLVEKAPQSTSNREDSADSKQQAKLERDKKEAISQIDVNNYASVVVIDDQPEVSVDDPAFVFDVNDGFQEVMSKRTQKTKLKAAQEEAIIKTKREQQKLAQLAKNAEKEAVKAAKLAAAAAMSSDGKRGSSGSIGSGSVTGKGLIPRFANKQQQQGKSKDKIQSQANDSGSTLGMNECEEMNDFLPKIENWNNDMANSIPSSSKHSTTMSGSSGGSSTLVYPLANSSSMAIGTWEQMNIGSTSVAATIQPQPMDVVSRVAGILDNSDSVLTMSHLSAESGRVVHADAAERQGENPLSALAKQQIDENRAVKKPDTAAALKVTRLTASTVLFDPIELPSALPFKYAKGEESSELKLDFTFDADLAKMSITTPDEKVEPLSRMLTSTISLTEAVNTKPTLTISLVPPSTSISTASASLSHCSTNMTGNGASIQGIQGTLQSPATEDLGQKIAAVKTVWDESPLSTVYEQSILSGTTTNQRLTTLSKTVIPEDSPQRQQQQQKQGYGSNLSVVPVAAQASNFTSGSVSAVTPQQAIFTSLSSSASGQNYQLQATVALQHEYVISSGSQQPSYMELSASVGTPQHIYAGTTNSQSNYSDTSVSQQGYSVPAISQHSGFAGTSEVYIGASVSQQAYANAGVTQQSYGTAMSEQHMTYEYLRTKAEESKVPAQASGTHVTITSSDTGHHSVAYSPYIDQAGGLYMSGNAVGGVGAGSETSSSGRTMHEQTNVCKVRPQLQTSTSPLSASYVSSRLHQSVGITSPQSAGVPALGGGTSTQLVFPSVASAGGTSAAHFPFTIGPSAQMVAQDGATLTAVQYGQPAYSYNLTPATQAGSGGTMLAQLAVGSNSSTNLFLSTGASQADLYTAASQQLQLQIQQHQQLQQQLRQQQQQQLYRNQYGSGVNQQNAILVSSSTPSLMSSAIKAPTQQQHGFVSSIGSSQKSNQIPTIQYGQLINNSALPPSATAMPVAQQPSHQSQQLCIQYDTSGQSVAGLQSDQMSNSQMIIGSQLVQRNTIQPSNYYTTTPLQQTSFYQQQQTAAAVQASYQQIGGQQQQYSQLSAYSLQAAPTAVPIQPIAVPTHSQLKHTVPPFKPSAATAATAAANQRLVVSPTNFQQLKQVGSNVLSNIGQGGYNTSLQQQQQQQLSAGQQQLYQQQLYGNLTMGNHTNNSLNSQYQLLQQQPQQQQQPVQQLPQQQQQQLKAQQPQQQQYYSSQVPQQQLQEQFQLQHQQHSGNSNKLAVGGNAVAAHSNSSAGGVIGSARTVSGLTASASNSLTTMLTNQQQLPATQQQYRPVQHQSQKSSSLAGGVHETSDGTAGHKTTINSKSVPHQMIATSSVTTHTERAGGSSAGGFNPHFSTHLSRQSIGPQHRGTVLVGGGGDSEPRDIKDQQKQERQKAIQDVASFLNPSNKPPAKTLPKSTSSKKDTVGEKTATARIEPAGKAVPVVAGSSKNVD